MQNQKKTGLFRLFDFCSANKQIEYTYSNHECLRELQYLTYAKLKFELQKLFILKHHYTQASTRRSVLQQARALTYSFSTIF